MSLPQWSLDIDGPVLDLPTLFSGAARPSDVILDIGFGGGEGLIEMAAARVPALSPSQLDEALTQRFRLLTRGEGFSISLITAAGRHMAAEGRAISGSATLRLHDVSGLKKEIAELTHRLQRQQAVPQVYPQIPRILNLLQVLVKERELVLHQ